MLAVSGLRIGTLVRLQYRHVKKDLEKGITPIHMHIEAEITKGKYHGYDTFLNHEAAEYLNAYLNARRKGRDKVPPENIRDESPLIRIMRHCEKSDPLPPCRISVIVRALFVKSGIVSKKNGTRMYELRSNSLRKFFRSRMAFLGVDRDYIEYMMGHKTDHYLDVKMMGIEYLRHIYQMSNISIWPRPETDKLVILKQTIQKLGLNPEQVLRPEFLTQAHI
jgi:integrase